MTSQIPPQNPYARLLAQHDSQYLVGRDAELETIVTGITSKEPTPASFLVRGMLRIGKTTFLYHLRDYSTHPDDNKRVILAAPTTPVTFDCVYVNARQSWGSDGKPKILRSMASGLKSMVEQKPETDPLKLLAQIKVDCAPDELTEQLQTNLKELFVQHHKRVVFLLDDFDEVLSNSFDDERFLAALSSIAPLVIMMEKPPEKLYTFQTPSPLLSEMLYIILEGLSPNAAMDLVKKPFDEQFIHNQGIQDLAKSWMADPIEEPEVQFILTISGNHPYLILATCQAYYQQIASEAALRSAIRNKQQDMTTQLQKNFIDFLLRRPISASFLKTIWMNCEENDKSLLKAMTELLRPNETTIPHGKAKKGSDIDLVEDIRFNGGHLVDLGILHLNIADGSYTIFSPLFMEYVRRQAPIGAPPPTRLSLDTSSVLPWLGPQEQSLLKQFSDQPDEVFSFEELLRTVWGNVEDSADVINKKGLLDAAIFRLRKGIERATGIVGTGANYIYNVRGRGFVFLPDGDPVRYLRKEHG